jgi:hypothetical protein
VDGWENFAIAQVGASAALAGLVLVGVSVNLDRVLAEPSAPPRIAEALSALITLLMATTILLIPGQPDWLVGVELTAIGVISWRVIFTLQGRAARAFAATHPRPLTVMERHLIAKHFILGQLATVPVVVAGLAVLFGSENGLYGIAVGAIGSFGLAFLDTWVLLIEINRISEGERG